MFLFSYVDLIVILVVVAICIAICVYLYFAYKGNPCGTCSESKRCSKSNKSKPNWVKKYHKCYGFNRIKYVFLDFNGTILDDFDLCFEILNELCRKYGVKEVDKKTYRNIFGFPVQDYYVKVGFDFNKIPYKDINIYFMGEYGKRWAKETKVFKNFAKYIKKIKADGIKVYIITATRKELLEEQLKFFEIYDLFDGFAACDNDLGKGKIEYSKDLIIEKNINVKKAVFMGDTLHDYEVATHLDMKCLLFTKGHNSKEKLKTTNSKLINSYRELYKYIEKNK